MRTLTLQERARDPDNTEDELALSCELADALDARDAQIARLTLNRNEYARECERLTRERDEARGELRHADMIIDAIDNVLRVPAAEYVPAISGALIIIDRFKDRRTLTGTGKEGGPCPQCNGEGNIQPAMDLSVRPPKEQAQYEREVAETRLTCPTCNGTGKEG